jgi:hypothetical protein
MLFTLGGSMFNFIAITDLPVVSAPSIFLGGAKSQTAAERRPPLPVQSVETSLPPMTEARRDLDEQTFSESDPGAARRRDRRDVWIGVALLLLALLLPPALAWLIWSL